MKSLNVALLVAGLLFLAITPKVADACFTCPGGTCAASVFQCPCNEFATLNSTIYTKNVDTTTANTVDTSFWFQLGVNVSYKTNSSVSNTTWTNSTGSCSNVNFGSFLEYSWSFTIVTLAMPMTLPATIVSNGTTVSFPANFFQVGYTYLANVTAHDYVFDRSVSATYTFTVLSGTPVVTVKTKSLLALPLNIEVATSVTDAYADGTVGTWSCVSATGDSCPANLTNALRVNGTNNGVYMSGPIPAGSYVLWMTYKSVRSSNVSLTVQCNASSLTTEGRCPGACAYTCPDTTCALSLSSCSCTLNASISGASLSVSPSQEAGKLDASVAVTLSASAQYRQVVGSCAQFDFGPYMTIDWKIKIGSGAETALPSTIPSNVSTVTFPAKYFTLSTTYTLIARFYNLNNELGTAISLAFVAVAPPVLVSVTENGSRKKVGPRNIRLPAWITDAYADNSVATWACTGTCGSALLNALSVNGTKSGVFLAGPLDAGSSNLTLTYKGVTSAPFLLEVSATEVPIVQIVPSYLPAIAPSTYLFTQTIVFAASRVLYSGPTTLKWLLNGVEMSTAKVFAVPKYQLLVNSENVVTLRAISTNDTSVFGETALSLVLAPNQTVTINDVVNLNNATKPLLALSDRVSLTYARGAAVAGAVTTYDIGYLARNTKVSVTVTSQTTTSFVSPYAEGGNLQLYVDLLLNGQRAAPTAYSNYSVRLPPADDTFQKLLTQTSTDPKLQGDTANTYAALLNSGTLSPSLRAQAANAILSNLLRADPQTVPLALAFGALKAASANANVSTASINLARAYARSTTPENAGTVLTMVLGLKSADAANATNEIAMNLANGAKVGGAPVVVSVAGDNGETLVISGQKFSASDLASALVAVGTTSVQMVSLGLADGAEVTTTGTVSSSNQFSGKPNSGVFTFIVSVNGAKYAVSALVEPIKFSMDSTDPRNDLCQYYDEGTSTWSNTGVTKVGFTSSQINCATTHLTSFAGFAGSASSGARVLASFAVVAMAALLQFALRI